MLIPYIIWPFIFFISNDAFTHKKKISFYELYLQIICGRQFSIPLWYLFSIIFLTILIYILLKIFKDFFLFIIQIIIILIYMIQYSHLYNLLDGYKDNVRLPILGTLNIFPLSALGLIFSTSQIFQILQIYRKNVLFFSYIIILHINSYSKFNLLDKESPKFKQIWFLNALSFWSVDGFAIISGVVGYKKYKFSNLIYIWIQKELNIGS